MRTAGTADTGVLGRSYEGIVGIGKLGVYGTALLGNAPVAGVGGNGGRARRVAEVAARVRVALFSAGPPIDLEAGKAEVENEADLRTNGEGSGRLEKDRVTGEGGTTGTEGTGAWIVGRGTTLGRGRDSFSFFSFSSGVTAGGGGGGAGTTTGRECPTDPDTVVAGLPGIVSSFEGDASAGRRIESDLCFPFTFSLMLFVPPSPSDPERTLPASNSNTGPRGTGGNPLTCA